MTNNVFAKSAKAAKDDMQAVMSGGKRGGAKKAAAADGYHTAAVRMSKELWRKCQLHRIETGESFNALAVRLLENEFSNVER